MLNLTKIHDFVASQIWHLEDRTAFPYSKVHPRTNCVFSGFWKWRRNLLKGGPTNLVLCCFVCFVCTEFIVVLLPRFTTPCVVLQYSIVSLPNNLHYFLKMTKEIFNLASQLYSLTGTVLGGEVFLSPPILIFPKYLLPWLPCDHQFLSAGKSYVWRTF